MAKQKERNDKLREEKEKLKKEKEELQKQKEEDESKKVSTLVLHVSSQNGWRALFSMNIWASFCLLYWGGEKKTLPELLQAFEVAAAPTSGLVNLVFSRQTGFF